MNKTQTAKRLDAIERLRKSYGVKAGSTIYTTVKHVSRSGMSRTIATYVVRKGQVCDVSHLVAEITMQPFDRDRGGVKLQGAGMDMTFWLVYQLSHSLWPNGHKCNGIESGRYRCPSNDHANDYGIAARQADIELAERGVALPSTPAESRDYHDARRALAAEIIERDGLTYRKGRVHRDGGYVLTRASL